MQKWPLKCHWRKSQRTESGAVTVALTMSETQAAFIFLLHRPEYDFRLHRCSRFKITAGALVITRVLWGRREKSETHIPPPQSPQPQLSQFCFRILPRSTHTSSRLSLARTLSHRHILSKAGREMCILSQIVVCPAKQLGLISVGEEENGLFVTTSRFC